MDELYTTGHDNKDVNAPYNGVPNEKLFKYPHLDTFKRDQGTFVEIHEVTECYVKLNHIVNAWYNLGEPIFENEVVKKVVRSLTKEFETIVTIIEEHQDLNTYKIWLGISKNIKVGLGQSKN